MSHHKKKYILISLIFIIVLFCVSFYGYSINGEREENYRASVILEASNTERFEVLKQGIESAAREYHMEVNVITVSTKTGAYECVNAIKRELKNGSTGLILNLGNDKKVLKELDALLPGIQVVLFESEIPISKGYSYIAPDNYQMGYDIGLTILQKKRSEDKVGIVVGNGKKSANNDRMRGLLEAIGQDCVLWTVEGEEDSVKEELKEAQGNQPVDILVGLNTISTEEIIDLTKDNNQAGIVYGIGGSEKIVYYVDKGLVGGLVAPNEYLMGYLSVKSMYNRMNYNMTEDKKDIGYLLINKTNLYQEENQKLMFPMVQ
ncbi:MAG: hypothetical protein PWP24_1359 [Clostridiales bacterium]|nr:hypothetical protein [Clostridiales bacterium]